MNAPPTSDALESLARLHGIQSSYVDAAGKTQIISREITLALLKALGIEIANERMIRDAFRDAKEERTRALTEPVYAVWGQSPQAINFRAPAGRKAMARLRLEDGSMKPLPPVRDGQVNLPALPFGYHTLEIEIGGAVYSSLLVCAPKRAYAPPGIQRRWGVFVPLYSLHSKDSWGAGDFQDGRNFAQWLGSLGGNVFALLPIMAAFLDRPFDPSPYAPVSRLFWNEFYLHIPALLEFSACAEARKQANSHLFQKQIRDLRAQPLVDYRLEMRLKRSVLEQLSRFFFSTTSERRHQFEQFLKARPEVRDYARFRAVTERLQRGWQQWPQRLRQGDIRVQDYDVQSEQYHLYAQWCAQQQMDDLRSASAALYLDMPLGVHPNGFDAWRERALFVSGATGGAPPDPFFTKGQNWCFAPFHPQELRRKRYRYYIEFVRFAMRHTRFLRIDHVMGLHRLFWVPEGFPASKGAYVTYPAEELYAILCLESKRHKTALIGENLGTVPPEVNKALARHGLSQMYVVQFEQPDSNACLRPPPRKSVASLNTHDMPPFTAYWKGLDLQDSAALGLLTPKQLKSEQRKRQERNVSLTEFLRQRGFLKSRAGRRTPPSEVIRACLEFLSCSEAELVLINLEDLWNEIEPQNTPGTSRERPNWRRKTRLSLEQILASDECRSILASIDEWRRKPISKSS